MKLSHFIIILFFYADCVAQHTNDRVFKEPWERTKQVLILTVWTTADAISDAWIAENRNVIAAHTLDAAGTGLLITIPFTCKLKWEDGPRFLTSFLLIRIGIFDPVYNSVRGFDTFGYRTDVSHWDKFVGWVNPPPSAEALGRGFSFSFGVLISLTGDKH